MFKRFRTFLGIEQRSALAHPSPELFALFGAPSTASGVAISPEVAMRCSTVFACVKVLAESVAQLPLHVYRKTADGGKERASDHPLYELLHDQPNPWTSAFEFRLAMQTDLCLRGNAYAFINRSGGRIVELIPLAASSVAVETDAVTMEPIYRVAVGDGSQRVYGRSDIFHLRTLGTSPHLGLSPITQMREAIALALLMEEHATRLFGSGARPAGIFKYGKSLSPEALNRLRVSFADRYSGGGNSGRTMILEDGMTFDPLQFSSVDSQFLELRRHQVAEIARGFRVPLHLLADLERATHANAESLGQQFLALTLLPWLKLWEGAIRRSLISPEERGTIYAEFMTDDLARADLAARFQSYATAVTNGILSPNEVRAAENRAPYSGGDQFRLPMNTESPSAAANDEDA